MTWIPQTQVLAEAAVPDTDEEPRMAPVLVVNRIPASAHGMPGTLVTSTRLEIVRVVDFYRDDVYLRKQVTR